VAEIAAGRDPLTDIDEGITQLGLGKNMVEALRVLDRGIPNRPAIGKGLDADEYRVVGFQSF